MTLLEFLLKVSYVKLEMSRLLKISLASPHQTPILRQINALSYQRFCDERSLVELDVVRFEYLVKHLNEIERSNEEVLKMFRRGFRQAKTQANFEGLRFEVYAAASLARKNISFQKQECPDFLLPKEAAGIECTSVRLARREPFKDLSYKVRAAISNKATTNSNVSNVILLVDITNILHLADSQAVANLRTVAQEAVSRTHFASVVLFTHVFEEQGRRISTYYVREDSNAMPPDLRELVEKLYPVVGVRSYNFFVPEFA